MNIAIGTLNLQDCAVGLLFAWLGGTSHVIPEVLNKFWAMVLFAVLSWLLLTYCMPQCLQFLISLSTKTNGLYQLALVAFCLLVAWCSDCLGLSFELGSFSAGVMISTADHARVTLEQVEPIRQVEPIQNLFGVLFLASNGMLVHFDSLWNHSGILLLSVTSVFVVKTIVTTAVVKLFGYRFETSLLVGISLAHIGEFAFDLLAIASNLHLVEGELYQRLHEITALSLVATPLLFKLALYMVRLGVQRRWFSHQSD